MKILEDLIEKMNDTLEEVSFYGEQALLHKHDHKSLSDVYIKIADMHINIYTMLHDKVIMLIEEERLKGVPVPPEMKAIWDYQHKCLIKDFAEAKYLVDEYKKTNY
jgi:hypothetical protein